MKNTWTSSGADAALIILLTLLVYTSAMSGGFIWDDNGYVRNNRALRSAEGLRQIWLDPEVTPQYYPLTFTVFWIEYHLWGLRPLGFHLVNVLLHAANAIVFWRLLTRLKVPGAWWAAAVFALHPVHVMSVAWIAELKNVLSGLFYLTALWAYLRFCGEEYDPATPPSSRRWFYGLAGVLYLCALFSKTSASLLPIAVLLILWWKRGRIGRKELMPLVPFFVVGVGFGAFTLWLEKYAKGASGEEFTLPLLERFLVAGRSFWFCLGKLVWPARLTFIYPHWQMDVASPWPYLFPLGVIALLITLWRRREQIGRAPLAAMVYFVLSFPALVMVQVLFMMRFSFVADHWQYLGSMSVIPLGIGGMVTALARWPSLSRKMIQVVLAILGLLTWLQGHVYHNEVTLWYDTLSKNPNAWMAHNNLGTELLRTGKVEDAIGHFEQALRLRPDDVEYHCNLGASLLMVGRVDDAIQHYEEAVRLKPDFSEAHDSLGVALLRKGKLKDATEQFQEALRISPGNDRAHNNLGKALLDTGDIEGAIEQFEWAVKINSNNAGAHNNLGIALEKAGRVREAIRHWEMALQIDPNYTNARLNLARIRAGPNAP